MFLFGHTGFAAAPAAALIRHRSSRHGREARAGDLRWLLAGSIFPDLVDKTIGQLLFKRHYENGRIYCHTVLFSSLLAIQGCRRFKQTGDDKALLLALGVISHIALDKIWTDPETAFWPLLGHFLKDSSLMTLLEQISYVLKDRFFWTNEITGAVLLLLSLRWLGIRNSADLKKFLFSGRSPALSQQLLANYNG